MASYSTALIVGAGSGLSASLARLLPAVAEQLGRSPEGNLPE
ncbi:MAG TPA: hypothetical protein PLY97_09765 [Acidocella sp.]|nr:hypothetical protein [Acidocella sp.]